MKKYDAPPIGIIKTMPAEWVEALPNGVKGWEKDFMDRLNNQEAESWRFNLSGKPQFDVLYFYINFDKAIRYRANIVGYEKGGAIKCYTGEVKSGKIWVVVTGPIIKAAHPIAMTGFQGFRYISEVIF
jgi:hypothetical protein